MGRGTLSRRDLSRPSSAAIQFSDAQSLSFCQPRGDMYIGCVIALGALGAGVTVRVCIESGIFDRSRNLLEEQLKNPKIV